VGPSGECAAFGATLSPSEPVPLQLSFVSAFAPPLPMSLQGFTIPPPLLGNTTRSVHQYTSEYSLYFQGAAPYTGRDGLLGDTTSAAVSMPGVAAFGGAVAPLALATCSSTLSLQQGVNCSAESPPAPAPSAATEMFVLERRRRQRRRALLQFGGGSSGGGGGGGAARAPTPTTCRGYYRTVTLLTSITLIATPPAPPDTAAGYATSPNWTLTVAPCSMVHTQFNAPVSQAMWRADSRPGGSASWCAANYSDVIDTALSYAPPNAMPPQLTITLRASGDPLLAAATLTHCRMAFGVPPWDYVARGVLSLLFGGALTAVGMWGLARDAHAGGHALGIASPVASLRAAYAHASSYGSTSAADGAAVGVPAAFSASVGGGGGGGGYGGGGYGAYRGAGGGGAGGVPPPPPFAAPFDGVTRDT
jgi:hypothetical protein